MKKLLFLLLLGSLITGCLQKEKNPIEDISFQISVTSMKEDSASFDVTPSLNDVFYYASTAPKNIFNEYKDANSFALSVLEELKREGETAEQFLFKGKQTIKIDGLVPGDEYVFYVFATNGSLELTSEVKSMDFVHNSDKQFTFEYTVTSYSVDIQVIPADPEMTYLFSLLDKDALESFPSDEALIKELIAEHSETGPLEKALKKGESFWLSEVLRESTEYYLTAFGVRNDGTVTTPLTKEMFRTHDVEQSGTEIEINIQLEHNVADYTITPSDPGQYFYYGFVTEEELADFTQEEWLRNKLDAILLSELGQGSSREEITKAVCSVNTVSGTKVCKAEQTTYLVSAGLNSSFQINTDIAIAKIEAGKAHLDHKIYLNLEKLSATSVSVNAATSGYMDLYFNILPKSTVEKYNTDDEFIDALMSTGSNIYYMSNLQQTFRRNNLSPSTEYCAVAFGYNEGPATPIQRLDFTTLSENGDPSQTTFDMKIVPYTTFADTDLIPSDKTVTYAYGYVTKDIYEKAMTDSPDAPAAYLAQQDKENCVSNPYYGLEAYLQLYTREGDFMTTNVELEPETEYALYAIALDKEYNPIGTGTVEPFKTKKVETTDASARIKNVKWFQMAELREAYPEESWYDGNNAVVTWEVEASGSATMMYSDATWADISGDTDEEIFEPSFTDRTKRVKSHGMVEASTTFGWEDKAYIFAIGFDQNGNYAPFAREVIPLSIETSSPASEFPKELLERTNGQSSENGRPKRTLQNPAGISGKPDTETNATERTWTQTEPNTGSKNLLIYVKQKEN